MLVVSSFHMSIFINEAPWTLGIFMFFVVCTVEYLLLMLLSFLFLNLIQLLIIMSLIKVYEVAVLGVVLVSDTVVNGLLWLVSSWSEHRCGNSGLSSISIMENLLSYVVSSLCESGPL